MAGTDNPKEVKEGTEKSKRSSPPPHGIERGLTGPTDAQSSGRTPAEQHTIEVARQVTSSWGEGSGGQKKKEVKFVEEEVPTNEYDFKSNRSKMVRNKLDFGETSRKIDGIRKDIKFLSDNVDDIKRLFEQDKHIKIYLDKDGNKDIKDFLEKIEETNRDFEGKVTSIRTQAKETIEGFDKAKSTSEQAEHLQSFVKAEKEVLDILRELEEKQKLVKQVKQLKTRAEENMTG